MDLSSYALSLLRSGDLTLYRGTGKGVASVLLVSAENGSLVYLNRLEREYALRGELDAAWAARPIALTRYNDRPTLVLEDPGGDPLDRLLGGPLDVSEFLRITIPLAGALRRVHERGLVHKDIKPGNILLDVGSGGVWLTGFGIASRLPRERQNAEAPEVIAGTLAYMAPEQTGRMNRSIDSRSDLYSLGITFYEMLTGTLPFSAADPLEWVHCHIARQPTPPDERVNAVPAQLSAIVMKLLAKIAEERYQTAAGVEADLRRCQTEWTALRRITLFPLGTQDVPDRLLIPEKLYGREREIDALLASFERVVANGTPELVLVSGYSGIGKSSVVNELHKVLVPPHGLFASGKFDQYKRDIPYATLAQAFQSLVRPLLGQSKAELGQWRDALREALGQNGQLMVNLVPELELVIGKQPSVPDLPPQSRQNRFQMVVRRFIGVFARPEHPLALFLDDLQWLDAAMLDLLEDLLTRPDVQHLMLIGAYRDNEVDSAHPLMRKLEAIRRAGATVREILLAPMAAEDLGRLLVDSLHCEPERVASLAQLIHEKTGGNPFFAVQFISSLAEEALLTFDHSDARWSWDLNRIHAKSYSDNVLDLMVRKLKRLPVKTQNALQEFACLGNIAEIVTLTIVHGTSENEVHGDLWEALRLGFIMRSEGRYKFVHDRVQEATYSLIPEELRAEAHLRIGRLLAAHTPPEKQEEAIFDIVNQVNRGAALITSQTERDQIAELNLIAGKRAKGATAYAAALTYVNAGTALLAEDGWERRRELIFALELNRAECEFLTGQLTVAEERLAALSNRATTTVEQAIVVCLRIDVCTTLDQSDRAVAVCLDYLRHIGIHWLPHPQEDEVRREYERIWSLLASRTIEDLIDLPLMEDVASLATVDVLTKVLAPAGFTDANLAALTICKAVSLSLERGNCDASCFAYVMLNRFAGPRFGDYQAGFRFGQLGYELVERRGLKRFEASTYLSFAVLVVRWIKHVRASRDLLRRAFEVGNRNGDITFAAYSCTCLITDLLFAGEPLADVQGEAEQSLAFAEKARFGLVIDCITTQLALIRMLRGLTPKFGCFDDGQFNELRIEYHLSSTPALAMVACWYWIRKLQGRYIAGDYAAAMDAASKAQPLLWTSSSLFEEAEYHFHAALVEAAYCTSVPAGERQQHIDAVAAHHRQLQVWAKNCPENFENRAALVSAEIARIQGRELEAEHLYEQAIRSAHENGFVHNEAIANELAANFYAARGFEKIARAYLQDARYGYLRWGADGKVRQMDLKYPHLVPHPERLGSGPTLDTLIERLDLTTVVKLSQAVAGEIEINRLIKILMETALEHAGAERGLLILPRGEGMWIEAEAITAKETVEVNRQKMRVGPAALPESVFHYVIRTRDSVLLDDAMDQEPFSQDPYILRSRSRSILCLPLIKQAQLIGVLYLENGLASHVFTPARIALLRLLASQAATSLENARLYSDLRDAEVFLTQAQRLSLTGSFCWRLDTDEITFSEELYRIFAFEQASAVTLDRITARVHPEDVPLLKEKLELARHGGSDLEYEIRLRMQDGSDKHLRTNTHVIRDLDGRLECVGAIQDATQHRLAEEALSKARSELARVSRMTSIGALTASIAHEITQPLAAIVANADSCLIWLAKDQPNLDKARRAAERIVKDGHRAGEVIQSIRAQARRSASEMVLVDLNRLIVDTLELMQAELQRHEVLLETRLLDDLALIKGDHTQLQQVIVNLVTNAIEAISTSRRSPRIVRVSTESYENGEVLTIVEDSGSGIDLQVLDCIFDPMFTTKPEGMGLGLSICRSIVEGHGGRLWVSPNPAGGSIFQFSIPDATTAVSIEAAPAKHSARHAGHPV